jgi:hypothetical protein
MTDRRSSARPALAQLDLGYQYDYAASVRRPVRMRQPLFGNGLRAGLGSGQMARASICMTSGRLGTDKLGEETNEKEDLDLLYIACAVFMRLVGRAIFTTSKL